MTNLIGLNGRRGAGKDTAFGLLHQWLSERGVSSARRGFADALKLSFARMFIPTISLDEAVIWCDELKQDADLGRDPSFLTVRWGGASDDGTVTHVEHRITGRQALQRYGTEGHRDVFDDNFWVDALLPTDAVYDENENETGPRWPWNFVGFSVSSFLQDSQPPDVAFVTDCRFPNEAQRIRELDGKVWALMPVGWPEREQDGHASETPLPDDLVSRYIRNPFDDLDGFRSALIYAYEEDFG